MGLLELEALSYALLNLVSASGIVFANKAVFQSFEFHFTYALTLVHTLMTLLGLYMFEHVGVFKHKGLPLRRVAPLAAAYVGYLVFCNLNLKINTVGFYQISKLATAPAVLVLEWVLFRKQASTGVVLSIGLVCIGIGLTTITDTQLGSSSAQGFIVGFAAAMTTALYQIWAGSKQKELDAGSLQLLQAHSPVAAVMLAGLVLVWEPIGLVHRGRSTLLGYPYTGAAVVAILLSAVLGLLVSLSTFLVIGATSSLTYNVVGHLKTVIILTGGCLVFGDEMSLKKLAGVSVAMTGIIWYSHLKMTASKRQNSHHLLPISQRNGAMHKE